MNETSRGKPESPVDSEAHPTRRPNVVLILADDLGYGDLSSYGAEDMRTPNIDSLGADGIRCDNFYANSPVCSPTRASLLTGCYPDKVGVPGVIRTHANDNWGFLSPQAVLLPEALKAAGYQSALVGKWHLGLDSPNLPNLRGFDMFRGFLGDMMDDYLTHLRHGFNYMRRDAREIVPEGHATELFSNWAVECLKDRKDATDPFFLYLAFNAPHAPIQPPPEFLERVLKREPKIDARRARLVALIEHMDDGVGRVLKALRESGHEEDTLVIFLSDNGGQLDVGARVGPYRGGKQDLYEGGIRVPAVMRWPGRIAPGSRFERVALSMDLFPTILDAAGLTADSSIDGISLSPHLQEPERALPERDLFWARREGGRPYYGLDYHAARRGNWKLVRNHPFEPYQLYDLEDDPQERRDRSGDERAIFDDLVRAMQAHLQEAARVPWQEPKWN